MSQLGEALESYQNSNPPGWDEIDEDVGISSSVWGIEDDEVDEEPTIFDSSVEEWFTGLADYLDQMSRRTGHRTYAAFSDKVRNGIETFRGKTKQEAVDLLVSKFGGKPGAVVNDNTGLVWSRRTLCSSLSSWASMIEALPN